MYTYDRTVNVYIGSPTVSFRAWVENLHELTNKNTGLISCVHAWNRDQRPRDSAATVSNVDLSARNIELCAAEGLSDVQSDLFSTNEVLAGRKRWGKSKCDLGET